MARRDRHEDDDWDDDPRLRRRRKQARIDKKNRTLYILLAAGAVVVMFCGGVAVYVASAVKQVARAVRQVAPQDRPFEAGEPNLTVKAEDLYRAYERNEQRADDRYLAETVRVDGTVVSVEPLPGIGWRVTLSTGLNQARIHADFEQDKGMKLGRLTPGQPCSIVGICDGKMPDVLPDGRPAFGPTGWVVGLSACRLVE